MDMSSFIQGIAGGIVGGSCATVLSHWLARRREFGAARRNAAIDFQFAIFDALKGLYPLPGKWPEDIDRQLGNVFASLQMAVGLFRPFVPKEERAAFDRAWAEYRCSTGRDIDVQSYHHYMAFNDNPDPRGTFRRNVDSLLRFAPDQ